MNGLRDLTFPFHGDQPHKHNDPKNLPWAFFVLRRNNSLDLTQGILSAMNDRRTRNLGVCAHACGLKQRPDIGAAVAADSADQTLFHVGQPHVIGP